MFDKDGLGNYGADPARTRKSGDGREEMDEKDHEIAHTRIIARNRKLAESSKLAIRHGQVVPKDVGARLTVRLAADEDLEDASIASMIERDRQDSDGDYLFTLPEETKERWLERKQRREKKKV